MSVCLPSIGMPSLLQDFLNFAGNALGSLYAVQTAKAPSLHWTFIDKQNNPIDLEWGSAKTLDAVRSVYVEAYAHDQIYRAFFQAKDQEAAKEKLGSDWTERADLYRGKLEGASPEAYFAVAKKGSKIIGFALFDTHKPWGVPRNRLPPEEVYVTPIMVLPEAQGTGVGKELLFSILRRVPDLKTIALTTFTSFPASNVYRHLGFEEIHRRGEVLFMEKKL